MLQVYQVLVPLRTLCRMEKLASLETNPSSKGKKPQGKTGAERIVVGVVLCTPTCCPLAYSVKENIRQSAKRTRAFEK